MINKCNRFNYTKVCCVFCLKDIDFASNMLYNTIKDVPHIDHNLDV